MLRIISTLRKELLILLRDRGGLAILFLMPMAMIIIMALIQDAPFRDYQELKIPLLLVNNDTGNLGKTIENGLKESKIFEVTTKSLTEAETKRSVKAGDFEIGIIIPEKSSEKLELKVTKFVNEKLAAAGLENTPQIDIFDDPKIDLVVFFSPDTKKSFKVSVLSTLKQFTSKLETGTLLESFGKALNKDGAQTVKKEPLQDFVNLREENTVETPQELLKLNSVQHNVPAWTIFGMFFIVITLAASIIKERDDGSYTRILTMPGSYITVMTGKISAYLIVCLIQCFLMLLVGIFVLPHLGLPTLVIGHSLIAIIIVAVSCGLAATGYGMLVGTLFSTHQQSSTFGAVSVIILAALGGIWVPVFVMPEGVRMLAEFSPLYWALSAFHKIFIGGGGVSAVLPYAAKLLIFFAFTILVSWFYNKKRAN